ncbi:MAG: type II toxin-antitoxin system YafQ family toxin [Cyanobacteria bacterium P01_A01_bin.116]
MRELVLTAKFKRALRKFVKRNPDLKNRVESTLQQMEIDIFAQSLKTHKLSGNLADGNACSCGYDCRIIFTIEKDAETGVESIILINVGTHDDVY